MSPSQQGPWQGALPLQALAALAAPTSHLRKHILSSMQQLIPAMLAASIGSEHNQQMVVAMLHVIRHKLAPFIDRESEAAGSLGLNLLTGVAQLTTVMFSLNAFTSFEQLTMTTAQVYMVSSCTVVHHCGVALHMYMSVAPVALKHR